MVNVRTFDLNLLRIFEALIQDRSVSRAADRLGLSQPAVSNALNRMRHQFGDPLFVRTHAGMEPTPKAQGLAESILHGLTTIRSGLAAGTDFDPATSRRKFTLLMTDVGEVAFLPGVIARLRERAPLIDLHVSEYGIERYDELLETGFADLAVGRINLPDRLLSQVVHTSPTVVLLAKTNPRLSQSADGTPFITLDDYMAATHVFVMPRGASSHAMAQALGPRASQLRIALSIPHATVLPMIIHDTGLIATVPKVCADQLIENDELCYVAPPLTIEPTDVLLWWHKRNHKDPGHRWLRGVFAEAGAESSN